MVKSVFDQEEKVIKVDSPEAKVTGRFGSSLLYEYGQFNFHPRAYEILNKIGQLKFREDDVILTMFPKSGSTWLSECIYLVVRSYNYDLASTDSIEMRFPQIDSPSHDVFNLIIGQYDSEQQRLIKSSVPPSLLITDNSSSSVRPKTISILRNPRDILVSFYHHCKTVKHYDIEITFDEFFESFISGKVPCGPIWLMFNETYDYYRKNSGTSLMILFEDMKKDLRTEIKKICKFLSKPEPASEDEWLKLLDHLSVGKMRQNRTINRHDWTELGLRNANGYEFVRKGQVGDWKTFFSQEQSLRFDREITDKLVPELRKIYGPQDN